MILKKYVPVAVACLALATACRHALPPPTADDLKQLPLVKELSGRPPAGGMRYWKTPFQRLPLRGCYVSVTANQYRGRQELELWQNVWGEGGGAAERGIIVHRASALRKMFLQDTVCEGSMISDVMDPGQPDQLAPGRGFTRPFMLKDPEAGYVLLACVCPDYQPGTVSLLPALLTSPSGLAGSFTYLGKLTGEPATEAAQRKIWSDGGALVRLPDGRWRIYLNGYGQVLAALESAALTGPWTFLRSPQGEIREMLPDFYTVTGRKGCFPTVLKVADDNWHLWLSDAWPPQSIWHYSSTDGLTWKLYGDQPEITRTAFMGHGIKCLRAYYDPATNEIVGLLSIWGTENKDDKGWILHESRMPARNQPAPN